MPAWISVTPERGRLRTGEPLREAFGLAAEIPEVIAVGVNCCDPADVDGAIGLARAMGAAPIAYPNTGELWDAAARDWTGESTLDTAVAQAWADEGARALGGCCRVGPALLAQIAAAVSRD